MTVSAGAVAGLSVCAISFCLIWVWRRLHFYAHEDTPWPYLLLVGGVWLMGITALGVLLPIDVATSAFIEEEDAATPLVALWRTNYWLTSLCCWVINPIANSYWISGAFTWKRRLRLAIISNIKFWLQLLAVLVVALLLVLIKQNFEISKVTGFVFAAANTYGLFIVVMLLGYGLVELPREIVEKTNPRRMLDYYYCSASRAEEQMMDAQADLMDILDEVDRFTCDGDILLQVYLDQVKAKAKVARDACLEERSMAGQRVRRTSMDSTGGKDALSALEQLHSRLKLTATRARRSKFQWKSHLDSTAKLEEKIRVLENQSSLYQRLDAGSMEAGGLNSSRELAESALAEDSSNAGILRTPKRMKIYYKILQGLAILAVLFTLVVLWNECASSVSSKVSVFALMVHYSNSLFTRWLFCILPLSYLTSCVYVGLFKFKRLDKLTLSGHRQTDVTNLLANASYLGRIQFSLGVNYTTQLMTDDRHALAFYSVIGEMNVVPILGDSYIFFLPLLILLLAVCTYFRVLDRLLNMIGVETHNEPGDSEGGYNQEMVQQGKQLISRYRTRLERRRGRDAEIAEERSFSLREF